MISLTPCTSKMLRAHGYHAPSQTLAVDFGAGRIYHYKDVPQDIYDAFSKSESIGAAFGKLVRGQFTHEIVAENPEPPIVAQ